MRTRAAVLAVSLALLLTACIGLHSSQPVQQQYLLSLPPATAPAGAAGAQTATGDTLEVLAPVAAAGLGGEGIAVVRPGQRLDEYNGARWAAAAPAMLQTLAIEALRRQGHFSLVESEAGPFAASYVLNLELTHFEADYASPGTRSDSGGDSGAGTTTPTVRLTLVCTLGRRADRSVVTTLTVDSSVQAEADRMQAVIAAFQRATDAALKRLAAEIAPVPSQAPAPALELAPSAGR